MIPKIVIDDAKKQRIIDKASHLGAGEGVNYGGCAPVTFASICEAFRSEGIELFTPEVQVIILQGLMGLHSGIGYTGVGTCGGIIGSAFAIAYVVGVTAEDIAKSHRTFIAPCIPVLEDIIDRFEETYGAFDCLKLRYNRIQRAFDFSDPDASFYEVLFSSSQKQKCGVAADCYECGRDQGMPSAGARWGAESICDLLNKEPEERKQLPPHLQGFDIATLTPKVEKISKLINELGMGRPNEKISWREYRKFKLKGKKAVEDSRPCGVDAPKKKNYSNE